MTYNQKIVSYLPLLFKFEVLKAIVEPNLTPRYDTIDFKIFDLLLKF